jgi:Domain of unknown function (DUF4112)
MDANAKSFDAFFDPSAHGTLKRLEAITIFMDSSIPIPGTKRTVGADAVLGFVPVIGPLATTGVSLYLLAEAARAGAPAGALLRMGANVAIDSVFGSIPVAGTVFDLFFKANVRNMRILRKHLEGAPT